MRFDKFTIKAQEAIQSAESHAHRYNHPSLDPEHLLLSLVEQSDGVIPPLLDSLGVKSLQVKADLEKRLAAKPKAYGDSSQAALSPGLNNVLHKAENEALELKDEYVSTCF